MRIEVNKMVEEYKKTQQQGVTLTRRAKEVGVLRVVVVVVVVRRRSLQPEEDEGRLMCVDTPNEPVEINNCHFSCRIS